MINALLKIRLKQIYREATGIGLIRFIFLVCFVGLLGAGLYTGTSDKLSSQYLGIGFLMLILLIHLKRGDKLFLKSHFASYKVLMLSEYIFLSIPFIICFFAHKQWLALSELSALLIIVNLDIKRNRSTVNTKLQKLIPDDAFEWKAGVRKQFFIIAPLWIIAALTSFYVGSVPIAIFILGSMTLSFFDTGEPYQILLSYELSPKKLLILKIKRQLQLFSVMAIPLILLFLLFNPGKWYIPTAIYIILCFLHIYTITTKYAFYEPNIKSPAAQIFLSIGAVGSIIPFLLPVVWLLTIWFYTKSVNNLNFYLNDYNS